ncbi:MAG TPA: DUF2188 domain-containing protein [Conexibacter sp.]|nr:DUF2188 domain-containing protein [Conexibacter sp.]
MATKRYVQQNAHGGWEVLKEGHRRAPNHYETQQKALARARELARREGGGEIRVMNTMGKVVDAVTVPRTSARPKSTKRVA